MAVHDSLLMLFFFFSFFFLRCGPQAVVHFFLCLSSFILDVFGGISETKEKQCFYVQTSLIFLLHLVS